MGSLDHLGAVRSGPPREPAEKARVSIASTEAMNVQLLDGKTNPHSYHAQFFQRS